MTVHVQTLYIYIVTSDIPQTLVAINLDIYGSTTSCSNRTKKECGVRGFLTVDERPKRYRHGEGDELK